MIDFFTSLPAWILAHPMLTVAAVAASGAAYLGLLSLALKSQDRADRRRSYDRYHRN